MNLLILAGGKASRLSKYTEDRIPKLLLSVGNELFIDKLLRAYENQCYTDSIYIVFSELDYLEMTKHYLNTELGLNVKFIYYPKTDGTYNTLCHAFDCYPELMMNTVLSWSDIIPEDDVSATSANHITIVQDIDKRHRYSFENNLIEHTPKGNGDIAGLYIINDVRSVDWLPAKASDEYDLVQYLQIAGLRIGGLKSSFYDIGDCAKFEAAMSSADLESRWFNDISSDGTYFTKKSNSDYGKKVMSKESDFLNFVSAKKVPNFPKVYSATKDQIVLEDLSASHMTLHEYLETTEDHSIINKVFTAIEQIKDATIIDHPIAKDALIEYYKVPFARLNKIRYALDDNTLSKAFDLQSKLFDYINTSKRHASSLIHGDPNSANIMINVEDQSVMFIDPRGVFGETNMYGDSNYDLAKVLYGVTGYSKFNSDPLFHNNYSPCDLALLDELTDDTHLKILVGIIWLKLPYYIKNNLIKSDAAYEQGIEILERYLP